LRYLYRQAQFVKHISMHCKNIKHKTITHFGKCPNMFIQVFYCNARIIYNSFLFYICSGNQFCVVWSMKFLSKTQFVSWLYFIF